MKKRILSLLLSFCLLLPLLPIPARAAISGKLQNCNIYWSIDENFVLTISGSGSMRRPNGNSDYPWDDQYFHTLIIEEGVTSISELAFFGPWGGDDLHRVELPDSLTSIGEKAFYGSPIRSVIIPAAVTYIGPSAFSECHSLIEVTLLSSESLAFGVSAFEDCSKLESINIPDSVTHIGDSVFKSCDALTSVSIPDSVTSIGDYAFAGCEALPSIPLPDSLQSIDTGAFEGCTGLTSVTLPDSLQSTGNSTFSGCSGLTSVTLPDSLQSIGTYAFQGCTSLTSVPLPDSLQSIDYYAFKGCTSLTSIPLPDSLQSIGGSAFEGCTGLTSVPLPDSLQSIGNWAFRDCSGLTSITPPNSSQSFGVGVYTNCDGLTSLSFTDSTTSIPTTMFSDCDGLTSVTFSDTLTSIGAGAFKDSDRLSTLVIPESVDTIGSEAFAHMDYLDSVTFLGDAPADFANDAFDDSYPIGYISRQRTWPRTVLSHFDHIEWGYYDDPPVTEPPVTEPPVTEPPTTEPPATEPPVTGPPVVLSTITGTYTTDLVMPAADLGVSAPDSVLRATLTFTEDGKATATWEAVDLTAFKVFFHEMFISSYYAMAYGAGITDIQQIEQFCMESTGMNVSAYMDTIVTDEAMKAAFTPASTQGTYRYAPENKAIFTDLALMDVPSDPNVPNSFTVENGTLYLNAASWCKPDYTFVCTAK